MMQRVWSVDLPNHIGRKVVIAGWLLRLRRLSQVSFVILRDGRGLVQGVLDDPVLIEQVAALHAETVLRLEGEAVSTPQAPRGGEVRVDKIDISSEATEPPPFELHRPEIAAQLPTFLDHAAVGLRHLRHRAMFRLAAASVEGFRRALAAEHFVEIFTPKLVATATEGGANVFAVDYFGRPAYLAQSPQLYKQTMVGVFERVFEVGPVFRAEPHDTPRHLNEYVSLDVEMGFIADHSDVMRVLTQVLARMVTAILEDAAESLALLGIVPPKIPASIPAIHFRTALEMISEATA